mgnify:FL=1
MYDSDSCDSPFHTAPLYDSATSANVSIGLSSVGQKANMSAAFPALRVTYSVLRLSARST